VSSYLRKLTVISKSDFKEKVPFFYQYPPKKVIDQQSRILVKHLLIHQANCEMSWRRLDHIWHCIMLLIIIYMLTKYIKISSMRDNLTAVF